MVVLGTLRVPFTLNLFVPTDNCSTSQSFNINIAKEIIPILQSYSTGDFQHTASQLKIEEYEKLVVLINRFDQNTVLGKTLRTFFNHSDSIALEISSYDKEINLLSSSTNSL